MPLLTAPAVYELATGLKPFAGLSHGEIVQRVVLQGARPRFPTSSSGPASLPPGYITLAEACWAQDPMARPGWEEVAHSIATLRKELLLAD